MSGFSMVELVIVLAVIMVITAVSTPYFIQAFGTYQLNDAATQVAGILKFTRYQAIRTNAPISLQIRQITSPRAQTSIWTDINGDGVEQATEKQVLLDDNIVLDTSAVPPNTAGLATKVGVATLTPVPFSATSGAITFDQRGAVVPASVGVLYVGNSALATYGYRAVILFPSGSVQIWTADKTASAGWQQIN
jgi:Tfp pilus assembly protein FimT